VVGLFPEEATMTRLAFAVLALLATALPLRAGSPHLIAVDSNRSLYEIDMANGGKTQIGTVSANAGTTGALAIGASNTVYVSSTSLDSLFTIELPSGNATLVGAYGDAAIVMHGLEYVPATDTLYGLSSHNNGLYVINKTTGVATLVGTSALTSFSNLGWNSTTGVMYLTNSGSDSLYTVDLATGATTLIGPLGGPTNPNGLAYDPDSSTLFLVDNNTDTLYTLNLTTGAATAQGSTGTGNLLGLAYINGPIPVELMGFTVE
jgi:DNA-binding beta-propeller fold protein YncE